MNPILAIGQIIVSIALIAAILLQARGTGLSGTFGGDSAVYRSRRGVERRLWQFTIVLLVLFVVFSLASLHPRAQHDRLTARAAAARRAPSTELHDPNRYVRGRDPRRAARARRGPHRRPGPPDRPRRRVLRVRPEPGAGRADARPYVEGALGAPVSVTPLTARTQVDRDLVALVFSGLVRNGPDGTIVPDLAERWSVDATGKTWTVDLRDDARWHDGEPVTADDVAVHDPRPSRTRPTPARRRRRGARSAVDAVGPRRVVFTLRDAARRLPPGADPAARPGPPPGRRPGRRCCARPPVRPAAGRLRPVRARRADRRRRRRWSRPATSSRSRTTHRPTPSVGGARRLADDRAADRAGPTRPLPYLAGIDFRFYTDPATSWRPTSAPATSTRVSGISRAARRRARAPTRQPPAALPGRDADHGPAQPAPEPSGVRRPGGPDGAPPGHRPGRLIDEAYAMSAATATGPDPAVLAAVRSRPPIRSCRTTARRASQGPQGGRLDAQGRRLVPAQAAKDPLTLEVLSPTQGANPGLFAAAEAVVRDWTALGLHGRPTCRCRPASS